jgi:hypothetical protein
MPYSVTLRSRIDATVTGWYDGSRSRWSTDQMRQGFSIRSTRRNRYATNCAASAREMPK